MTPSSLLLTMALQAPVVPAQPPPELTSRILELGRRVETVEDEFQEGLVDLANLDLVTLAW
ncbi:MAG: hypothetical protein O2816_09990, partial [Planctomycetota bacterium]|nr:hypothetical protein [Planctomycetota bacterium]